MSDPTKDLLASAVERHGSERIPLWRMKAAMDVVSKVTKFLDRKSGGSYVLDVEHWVGVTNVIALLVQSRKTSGYVTVEIPFVANDGKSFWTFKTKVWVFVGAGALWKRGNPPHKPRKKRKPSR